MNKLTYSLAGLSFLSLAGLSFVAQAAHDESKKLETVVVSGRTLHGQDNLYQRTAEPAHVPAVNSAQLLKQVPGANVNKNGELTGIPQYRGMFGDRVNVSIDGVHISSGGPNAMDAPLHYAPSAILQSLSVTRGIASVSAGQETIGGAVVATTRQDDYGESGEWGVSGSIAGDFQTVNDGKSYNLHLAGANDNHIVYTNLLEQRGDDMETPEVDIHPSEYDRSRYDIGYRGRSGASEWSFNIASNQTDDSGTPALPMDIAWIDTNMIRSAYSTDFRNTQMSIVLGHSEVEHLMTNYQLRDAPMRKRHALAEGESTDFKLVFETPAGEGAITYGLDMHNADHRADIGDPDNRDFFVENFSDVERDVKGVFSEYRITVNERMKLEAGLRFNRITMGAGDVDSSMAQMGMPMMRMNTMTLRDTFNNSDRSSTDNNVEAVFKLAYEVDDRWTVLAGIARKTRSPSYQEKYLWLPMQSTGGLADGMTYIGDVDLDTEVSRELELGFRYETSSFAVEPRIFHRNVADYIQGVPTNNAAATRLAGMMNPGGSSPLQFSNVDSDIYGIDIDAIWHINARLDLRGQLSYIRGKRDDISDDLYRITPPNMALALDYLSPDQWKGTVELRGYDEQDKVSVTNGELKTPGYSLVNLFASFQPHKDVELVVGMENVFDRKYDDHLSGYNRAMGTDIAVGDRLPGSGRNLFAKVKWSF